MRFRKALVHPEYRIQKVETRGNKPGLKRGKNLTIQQIDQVFALYCDRVSRGRIAEETGISYPKVCRLISEGYPSRHIPPLKDRRAKVMAALLQTKDTLMVEQLSGLLGLSSRATAVVGSRVIDRVNAATQLDNPALSGQHRKILERKALDPDFKDFNTVVNTTRSLVTDIRDVVGLVERSDGVSVTINNAQTNNPSIEQTTVAGSEDIDNVVKHLKTLSNMDEGKRMFVQDSIKGTVLDSNTESIVPIGD